jgi:hypothetical protein
VPTTYEPDHEGAGLYYAVDFRYAAPQELDVFDWTPNAGTLTPTQNVIAAHAGILTITRERFLCGTAEVVQSTLKIADRSGTFTTWYSHLETIKVGDVVVVHNANQSGVNLRICPSLTCPPVLEIPNETKMYVEDGPVREDGHTWWLLRGVINDNDIESLGWAAEAENGDRKQILLSSLFHVGEDVVVQGATFLRADHRLSGTVLELMPDGTQLRIIGGPVRSDRYTWWNVSKGLNLEQGWVAEAVDPPGSLTNVVLSSTPKLGKPIAKWAVLGAVANYGCAGSGAHLHFMVTANSGRQLLTDKGPVRLNGEAIFDSSEGLVCSLRTDPSAVTDCDEPGFRTTRRLAFSSMLRNGIRGDLNTDGVVNASDLQLEVNVILGKQFDPTIESRSDLTKRRRI